MSAQPQQAAAAGAERVVAIRKTPGGPGQQYEISFACFCPRALSLFVPIFSLQRTPKVQSHAFFSLSLRQKPRTAPAIDK
jgi:hypothetical protein